MSTTQRVSADRTLAALRERAAALIGQVREAATASILQQDPGAAAGLFSTVPIGVCVELVEVYHAAQNAGYAPADLTAQLGEEEQLVFEMVVGMYDTACQASLPTLLESAAKLRDALS